LNGLATNATCSTAHLTRFDTNSGVFVTPEQTLNPSVRLPAESRKIKHFLPQTFITPNIKLVDIWSQKIQAVSR
jgi:hypothetical protein